MKELYFKKKGEFLQYIQQHITGVVEMRKSAIEIKVLTADGRTLASWDGRSGVIMEMRRSDRSRKQ